MRNLCPRESPTPKKLAKIAEVYAGLMLLQLRVVEHSQKIKLNQNGKY